MRKIMTKLNARLAPALVCLLLMLLLSSSEAMGQRPKKRVGGQSPAASKQFFPLRPGDSWTYRHSEGSQFTVKVLSEQKQPDNTIQYLVELSSGNLIHYYYSNARGWILLHSIVYPQEETGLKVEYNPAKQYLPNPLANGVKWEWKGKDIGQNDVAESSQVIGPEWVEVPAGRFRAVKIISKVTLGGSSATKTYWYADGVGLVKSTTEAKSAAGLFNYGFSLIDYSFKKGSSGKPATVAPPNPSPSPTPTATPMSSPTPTPTATPTQTATPTATPTP
jgi:hypothetical protein